MGQYIDDVGDSLLILGRLKNPGNGYQQRERPERERELEKPKGDHNRTMAIRVQ